MRAPKDTSPPSADGVLEAVIYMKNLEEAKSFYGDILGFEKVLEEEQTFVFFRCATTMVLVFNPEKTIKQPLPPPAKPIPGHGCNGTGHICFRAAGNKLDMWKQYLLSQEVEIEEEITWEGSARSIYFRDPAGNSLEFAQPKLWGYNDESTNP